MIDYRKVWEKEAREEGLAEGRSLGLAEGHASGLADGKIAIIKNMLTNGMSVEQAAQFSGLPVEEVSAIASSM